MLLHISEDFGHLMLFLKEKILFPFSNVEPSVLPTALTDPEAAVLTCRRSRPVGQFPLAPDSQFVPLITMHYAYPF